MFIKPVRVEKPRLLGRVSKTYLLQQHLDGWQGGVTTAGSTVYKAEMGVVQLLTHSCSSRIDFQSFFYPTGGSQKLHKRKARVEHLCRSRMTTCTLLS